MTDKAYIVAYGRSPIGKGKENGYFAHDKPEEIGKQVLEGVLQRVGGILRPGIDRRFNLRVFIT